MIKINSDYFKFKDVTIAEFGHGTIHFTIGVNEGEGIMACKSGDPKEIGERFIPNMTIEKWKPELLLKFDKIESLDVFIKELSMLKSYMKMEKAECQICHDTGYEQKGTIMVDCECNILKYIDPALLNAKSKS